MYKIKENYEIIRAYEIMHDDFIHHSLWSYGP